MYYSAMFHTPYTKQMSSQHCLSYIWVLKCCNSPCQTSPPVRAVKYQVEYRENVDLRCKIGALNDLPTLASEHTRTFLCSPFQMTSFWGSQLSPLSPNQAGRSYFISEDLEPCSLTCFSSCDPHSEVHESHQASTSPSSALA